MGKLASSLPGERLVWRALFFLFRIKKYIRSARNHTSLGGKFSLACREINTFSRPAKQYFERMIFPVIGVYEFSGVHFVLRVVLVSVEIFPKALPSGIVPNGNQQGLKKCSPAVKNLREKSLWGWVE